MNVGEVLRRTVCSFSRNQQDRRGKDRACSKPVKRTGRPSLSNLDTLVVKWALLGARWVSRCVTFLFGTKFTAERGQALAGRFPAIQAQRRCFSSARACNAESSGMRQSVKSLLSRVVIQILAFQSSVPRVYNLIAL